VVHRHDEILGTDHPRLIVPINLIKGRVPLAVVIPVLTNLMRKDVGMPINDHACPYPTALTANQCSFGNNA